METLNIEQRVSLLESVALQNKKILNFKEACVYMGFSKSTMYKKTMAGTLPFSKPNNKELRFERQKLEEWLLSNKQTA